MDKQLLGMTGLLATTMLVASAPPMLAVPAAAASATEVTAVRLSPTQTGFDVVLQTQGGTSKPQVFNVNNKDNSMTSYVFNARLANTQPFRQNNPAPGIAYVAVSPSGNNGIQIQVAGQGASPTGQITRKDAQGIVLSVSGKGGAATPRIAQAMTPATSQASNRAPQQIAQATPIRPLVPSPTLNTQAPFNAPVASPPLLPRASAPPVGDMSVSQMDTAPSTIDLGTAERIPRLVLRDAPVREVLSLLARAAGLNLAFAETPGSGAAAAPGGAGGSSSGGPTISLDIENESVQDVFNYVLRIACVPASGGAPGASSSECGNLEANRVGRTIFVGVRLPDEARDTISRTIRLNQVSVAEASAFLATQGAQVQRPIVKITIDSVGEVQGAGGGGGTGVAGVGSTTAGLRRTTETRETEIKELTAKSSGAPLLLRGVGVSTDERLNAITLVGLPKKVSLATSFLTNLDARKRQASVSVKIIDVDLLGLDKLGTSFSFGINDTSVINQGGLAVINLGNRTPNQGLTFEGIGGSPISTVTGALNPRGRWLGQLQLAIQSQNAKVLTDPTLTIQEGQRSQVKLVEEVISNFKLETPVAATGAASTSTITTEKAEAGLQLDLEVERIDDNGFISMRINPRISAPLRTQNISLAGTNNVITLLQKREVSTGLVRVRDGQTLLLTGVIQESDRTTATKVPILGDIPLLGALFRSTSRNKERKEVIVMVTPRIIDDSDKSTFGYGYTPGADVQKMVNPR
jgi:type IV pilus assembly protein PilQ